MIAIEKYIGFLHTFKYVGDVKDRIDYIYPNKEILNSDGSLEYIDIVHLNLSLNEARAIQRLLESKNKFIDDAKSEFLNNVLLANDPTVYIDLIIRNLITNTKAFLEVREYLIPKNAVLSCECDKTFYTNNICAIYKNYVLDYCSEMCISWTSFIYPFIKQYNIDTECIREFDKLLSSKEYKNIFKDEYIA